MTHLLRYLAIVLLGCSIAACSGGGGGGGGDSAAAPSGSSGSPTPANPNPGTETPTTPTTPTAHTLQLSWNVPTTRENGEAISAADLSGYEVYYFAEGSSADTGEVVAIDGGSTTNAQVAVNGSGVYYFAIAAVDQTGLTGALSNYVAVTLN